MKKFFVSVMSVLLAVMMLSACTSKEDAARLEKPVAFDTVEQARAQARDNAGWNAQNYRANSPQYQQFNVQNNGDSTQANDCPQGDGWASLKLVNPANVNTIIKIKCSTVSGGIGCMTEDEFKQKPAYSVQEGHCQPTTVVPFPLPKISGQ
jgi:hypothetical protein